MKIQTYQTIVRVDYPHSYAMLDSLGSHLQFINDNLKEKHFTKKNVGIDPANRVIKVEAQIDNSKVLFELDLTKYATQLEYPKGFNLDELAGYPGIRLSDKIISRLSETDLITFNRIGFRNWIIIADEKYSFNSLLKYFCDNNRNLISAAESKSFPINDIGLILEAEKDNSSLRINMGPYRESEAKKYFSFPSPIKEGLILDIDLYQVKVQIPKFNLIETIKSYQNTTVSLAIELNEKIKNELKT